jgi:hypothetical protein
MFKVISVQERTTATGKTYKTATIEENDVQMQVSVWPDFDQYAAVVEGGSVVGKIVEKGQYKNLVGNGPQKPAGGRTGAITAAQETKGKMIAQAQDNKELAVKIASTFGSAVQIALKMADMPTFEERKDPESWMQAEVEKWRAWLWNHWEAPKDKDWVENMTNPF